MTEFSVLTTWRVKTCFCNVSGSHRGVHKCLPHDPSRSFDPLPVVFLVAPDLVFHPWVPSRVHCSQQFLTVNSERSTWLATRRIDQPAVFIPMIRPLSNSLNSEKCLLARLPGMFRLPKSSYNRRVIVTFVNHRICLAYLAPSS
ncbi:uncharacterized protein TNCV_1639461 [Trichonephila clavipes]|nr:uncharacterized protein TNCV_1639461 [Trichonephila clavipes]